MRANSVTAYANLSFVLTTYGCQTGALRTSQEAIRHNALCAAFGTYSVCFLTTPWLLSRGSYGFLTSKKLFTFCFHQVDISSTKTLLCRVRAEVMRLARGFQAARSQPGRVRAESAGICVFRTVVRKPGSQPSAFRHQPLIQHMAQCAKAFYSAKPHSHHKIRQTPLGHLA